ncbi:MAG: peptidoglycan-binding protein [Deltaproteobacteria bacterium]|nr:peptidoglycan-binding protein [Deltaproteobacteria bacterium]
MGLQSELFKGDPKLEAAAVSDPAHIVPGAAGPHVLKIQLALIQLDGATLTPDEVYGPATAAAVLSYKRKRGIINRAYQSTPDNIVGKMTIAALDEELLKSGDNRFVGFSKEQISSLKDDLNRARGFLDQVLRKLSSSVIQPSTEVNDTQQKVRNVFKTDEDNPVFDFRRVELIVNYRTLRTGIAEAFPLRAEPTNSLGRAAFVVGVTDPTVHVHTNYFNLHEDDRAVTLIHERAHTLLKAPGHPGTGDVLICVVPHEGVQFPKISHRDAMHNAFCYELLTLALQPNYNAGRFRNNPMCTLSSGAP